MLLPAPPGADRDVPALFVRPPWEAPSAGRDAGVVQVFQNFVLRINRNSLSPGKFLKINSMTAPSEAQLDPMMNQAFAILPLPDTHLREQVNRSLFQHARPDALLGILAAAIFDDDGVDPLQIQKVREHETGGSRANNPDLRSQ